ncbi:MAG: ECF transporter S component [Chloroflexales bacterium]|nr:ECF transporter S component [Chloroflexales bacterium]
MMITISTTEPKKARKGWNTRDFLVIAVIGIVFGLLTIGMTYISAMLMAINSAFISILSGFYFIPVIMAMDIVRRPGTAVLVLVIACLAMRPFNPFGWLEVLISGIYGMACELTFLLTRYRNFRLPILVLSGAAPSILSLVMLSAFGGLHSVTIPFQIMAFVLFIVSGALLGG